MTKTTGFCGTTSRTAPSRAFEPYVFDNIDTGGLVVADADPERQDVAIVALTSNTVDAWVVTAITGANPNARRYWPLAPGEGIVLATAALVAVKSSTAGTPVSVKVLVQRGAVG